MPRKETAEPADRWRWLRITTRLLTVCLVLAAGMYAFNRIERFLLRDARFIVAPPDYGMESPSIRVSGERNASRAQILRVFAPDFNRSLYQVPLKDRRERLIQVDWVRDASISRIWPNRLLVRITEREPVAFIEVPSQGGLARFALIDADGVVLQPPKQSGFKLPVAVGIRTDDAILSRRLRVHRMMRLMSEIGQLGDKVSEVDVADPDNLKVTVRGDNRAIVLMLGDHNFATRMRNYVTHYAQIQQRLPAATTLDLRLEDRITVVEGKTE